MKVKDEFDGYDIIFTLRETRKEARKDGCKKKFIKKIFINLNRFANSLRHQFVFYVRQSTFFRDLYASYAKTIFVYAEDLRR